MAHTVETQERHGRDVLLAAERVPGAPAHPLGLVHIHGNILEWCRDFYAPYPEGLTRDPHGPAVPHDPAAVGRVLRGGSWNSSAACARSAFRNWVEPSNRDFAVGLRLVLPQPVGAGLP